MSYTYADSQRRAHQSPALRGQAVSVNRQAGQVGVIILLIMVVLLTVGLSLAARTTQELFVTQQGADSTRVFNAAESGIEQGLATDLDTATFQNDRLNQTIQVENAQVDYSVERVRELETRTFEEVPVMVDLPDDGTTDTRGIIIEWSKQERSCAADDPAALLVSVYNYDGTTTRVRYIPMTGCGSRGDGFETAAVQNTTYRFKYTLSLEANDIFVRIKPIYHDTHLKVTGNGWTLPVQYYHIRSEAKNNDGDETRIVEVNRTLPTAPSVLDYAVFSVEPIIK